MNITIHNIPVLVDGEPTEQGIELMRMCHEALGLGCYHDNNSETPWYCSRCESLCVKSTRTPKYLTSLDAWRPVWNKLTQQQIANHHAYLIDQFGGACFWLHPHHHLEALANVLEVDCDYVLDELERHQDCPSCNGTGKRKIIDIWRGKYAN